MPWQRKSPAKAERVVRRVKRDGTAIEYRYPAYTPRRALADTVDALIDAYMSSPEWAALADSTRYGRAIYLKPLAQILGREPVASIKRRNILSIRDAMITGRGPGAASAVLEAASALFKFAVDREWIEHPPTLAIKKPDKGEHRPWTRAEADTAAKLLPEHMRRVVLLARHTGQRRGDLCAMTWAAYDGASIRLTQQKTAVSLVIPLAPTFCAELDQWRRSASALTILTNAAGRPWIAHSLSHIFPAFLARIGLSGDLVIHGLRKLAATELADAGCTVHEIAAITGHRTLKMVEHYTRSADQERLATTAVLRLQQPYNRQPVAGKRK